MPNNTKERFLQTIIHPSHKALGANKAGLDAIRFYCRKAERMERSGRQPEKEKKRKKIY